MATPRNDAWREDNAWNRSWKSSPRGLTKRLNPDVRISFHTESALFQVKGRLMPRNIGELDPSYQVLSVQTVKTLASPAGTFSITLAGHEWKPRLKPNDIVVIRMGYSYDAINTVMVGLIDSVQHSTSMQGNVPSMNTVISGRDFGKLLLKSQLRFYPEIRDTKTPNLFLTEVGWIELMKFFTSDSTAKGRPDALLFNIMTQVLPKLVNVKWTVYDEALSKHTKKVVPFGSVVRFMFQRINMFLPFMMTSDQFEGSIWNLMERCTTKPFMELFVDCRTYPEIWGWDDEAYKKEKNIRRKNGFLMGKSEQEYASWVNSPPFVDSDYTYESVHFGDDDAQVCVVMREAPFNTTRWKKLTRHTIFLEDVINETFTRSDDQHYNLFWAGTTVNPLGIDLKRVAPPTINEAEIQRYGLSPLEVQIEGIFLDPTDSKASTNLQEMSKQYTARLKAWFQNNHNYENGTITMFGMSNMRVGQVAFFDPMGKEFYIEGVAHRFNCYTSFETTLTLTRGKFTTETIDHTKEMNSNGYIFDERDTYYKFYTVNSGDTLWKIAKKMYGTNDKWTHLWDENKEMIIARDARNIQHPGEYLYEGQQIRVPNV